MSKSDWNSSEQRLIIGCLEAKDLIACDKSGSSDPFVIIKGELDKKKHKFTTRIIKKDLNPAWNQLFFVPGVPKQLECQIWDKDSMSKEFMGLATLNISENHVSDVVCDEWYTLGPRPKDQKRGTAITGQLRLTTIRSAAPVRKIMQKISRDALPTDYTVLFWYKQFLDKFKTGDLILYSGTGPVDNSLKAFYGSNFSNAAVVVRRPSRWTGEDEILLYEANGNESQSLDSWSGTKKSGLCCFKLKERLHEFLGNGIFYCPSSADVEAVDEDRIQSALEWIQELHTKRPLTEYKETKEVDKEDVELTFVSSVVYVDLDGAVKLPFPRDHE